MSIPLIILAIKQDGTANHIKGTYRSFNHAYNTVATNFERIKSLGNPEKYHRFLICTVDGVIVPGLPENFASLCMSFLSTPEEKEEWLDRTRQPAKKKISNHENAIVVNCADCGYEIYARDIAGRIKGRPYCKDCLEPHEFKTNRGYGPLEDDGGPWGDKVLREYEDRFD